jgi:RNA polymerase sigma-70 factor (ECF subfamily)
MTVQRFERPMRHGEAMSEADRELVERARAGDSGAFEMLVRRHLRAAHAVAYSVLGERSDAEDVCQDAFIAALEQLDTVQPEKFVAWLLRIVRNRAISVQRQQHVRRSMPLEWANGARGRDDPAADAERSALRERLEAALAPLPAKQREVLLLHDLEGWKHREIGDLLGMKEGTVRYTLFEARRAVRARLGAARHKES